MPTTKATKGFAHVLLLISALTLVAGVFYYLAANNMQKVKDSNHSDITENETESETTNQVTEEEFNKVQEPLQSEQPQPIELGPQISVIYGKNNLVNITVVDESSNYAATIPVQLEEEEKKILPKEGTKVDRVEFWEYGNKLLISFYDLFVLLDLDTNEAKGYQRFEYSKMGMGCPTCFNLIRHNSVPIYLMDTTYESGYRNIPALIDVSDELKLVSLSALDIDIERPRDMLGVIGTSKGHKVFEIPPYTWRPDGVIINYVVSQRVTLDELGLSTSYLLSLDDNELRDLENQKAEELLNGKNYKGSYCTLDPSQTGQGGLDGCYVLLTTQEFTYKVD